MVDQADITRLIHELNVKSIVAAGADTLDDIPDIGAINPQTLEMMILHPFRGMIGLLLHGPLSLQFPSAVNWGAKSMRLAANECLQIRISPKNVLGNSDYDGVVVISSRIFNSSAEAVVTTAILWNMERTQVPDADVTAGGTGARTIGCRNAHLVLPGIFGHHDPSASVGISDGSSSKYCIVDPSNYHAVRPSTYTVMRTELPNDKGGTTHVCSTTPGMSTYVVAGALVGHDMPDETKRSAESIRYRDWQLATGNAMHGLEAHVGPAKSTDATNAALSILDLMSPEGLIGMLSNHHQIPLPDMLHVSSGLPLVIAAGMRIAAYSNRYNDLCEITALDKVAINEITSIFESSWSPITDLPTRTWAIDIVLRNGLNEAKAEARGAGASIAVQDNLLFMQRMAVRCATAIFGGNARSDNPKNWEKSRFGNLSPRVIDPIEEARLRAMSKHNLMDARPSSIAQSQRFFGQSRAELKSTLVRLMSSVEENLRTGRYGEVQVHKTNEMNPEFDEVEGLEEELLSELSATAAKNLEKKRAWMRNRMEKKKELRARFDPETRKRVKAMMGCEGSEEDMKAVVEAELGKDWQHNKDDRDTIAALALEVIMSDDSGEDTEEYDDLDDRPMKGLQTSKITKEDVVMNPKKVEMKIRQVLCVDAVMHANGLLAATFCQGPSVHHQLNVSAYLVSPHAVNLCSDCDSQVHVLSAFLLQCAHSHCWKCKRRRCLKCRQISVDKALKASQSQRVPSKQPCRRCMMFGGSQRLRPKKS